jgi:hypothetical protein
MSFPVIKLAEQRSHVRLQILLAKVRLSPSEVAQANALLQDIDDWSYFSETAFRNFSLPLVRANLRALDRTAIPRDFWDKVHAKANDTAFQNMRMIAAQKQFRERCLDPLGLDGLFFKGVSMAARYYPDLGLRPSRDIDVLVPKGTFETVLRASMKAGYVPVSPDATITPMTSKRDINALLRFADGATLLTPDGGVVIDLHDHLDKHSGIFADYDLFGNAEPFRIGGVAFSMLPTAFLFNYLCHHHTRHTWSRLHWLSDLDAICTSDDFDPREALALADQLGQRGTVEASLDLHRLMSTDTPWDDSADMAHGKEFLKLAILNLPGELALEKQVSLHLMGGEFMYDWQARPDLIARARRGWWRSIFRPTVSEYARMPLPRPFQWVYFITRAFELFRRTQQRMRPIKR